MFLMALAAHVRAEGDEGASGAEDEPNPRDGDNH
jgi:hypothetical protein